MLLQNIESYIKPMYYLFFLIIKFLNWIVLEVEKTDFMIFNNVGNNNIWRNIWRK